MDQDLKDILDAQGRAWEEFKHANTQRIEQAAKGAVDPLITAKIADLNVALDQKAAERDALTAKNTATIVESVSKIEGQLAAIKMGQVDATGLTPEQKTQKALFSKYLRRGEVPSDIKAMSEGSDPDGGYVVTADMGGRIVTRIYETSPMRQQSSVVTISTDRIQGLKDTDQAAATWVGEVPSGYATTTPQLGQWMISVGQLAAEPTITQVLLEDAAFDVEGWLGRKVADYFSRAENTAFVTGDGAGSVKPRGFASYTTAATNDAGRTWGVFEHVATGTSATFGTDPNGIQKLITLVHKLNPAYLANAKFFCNRSTLAVIRQLTDASSAGKFVFLPGGASPGIPDTVLGFEVVRFEDMADMAANSYSLAFGDMRETYTIVDRLGISVLRDPFTSKGNIKFYTRKRVGGDVVNFNSLKFMKFI